MNRKMDFYRTVRSHKVSEIANAWVKKATPMWLERIVRVLYRDVLRAGRADAEICAEITGGNTALWIGDGAASCTALVNARARAWYLAFVTVFAAFYALRATHFVARLAGVLITRLLRDTCTSSQTREARMCASSPTVASFVDLGTVRLCAAPL